MSNIKVAVIGVGYWGKNLVRCFSKIGNLAAISETNSEIANKLIAEYDVPNLTFDEILSDSDIQGVVIALPVVMHYKFAKEALLAGKHVFIEKPITHDIDQAIELKKLGEKLKKIVMVGHILNYHPAFIKMKSLVEEGSIGKVSYIYSNRLNIGKVRTEEDALWSFAPHDISMILGIAGKEPNEIDASAGYFLNKSIADYALVNMEFDSGVKAHLFVSWLHPTKEQRLIVVCEKAMLVFDDREPVDGKLKIYTHDIDMSNGIPNINKDDGKNIPLEPSEPLVNECEEFINCIKNNRLPVTDSEEGIRVLKVLTQASSILEQKKNSQKKQTNLDFFLHETSIADKNTHIGKGTKIWHFSHILENSTIGANCTVGQNSSIGPNVKIGSNCKIQNNISIYDGVELEDGVFCGPSCVFTNVNNPRAEVNRKDCFDKTLVKKGATIGANATIVCGVTLGKYCFIGAGAVVTKDVPDHALVVGNPARQIGWVSHSGEKLTEKLKCPREGTQYKLNTKNKLLLEF
jgi:UDP-2-acetamido-3-amino-2,3-dideoxy-glucuronate N-acetyltransferase